MAIGFVATSSVFSSTSSGTSITLNKPAGAGDNHLLVAYVSVTGVRTITPPTGWEVKETQSVSETGNSATLFVLIKNGADADPSSWNASVSSSTDRRTARVVAYSGAALAGSQFLTDNSNSSTSDTPLTRTTPTVNNTDSDAWRLSYFVIHDNGVSTSGPTLSTSNTERFDDHIGGTTDPTLTVGGYDSNGTISTGNTSVTATWTPGGSATTMDCSITWIGILRPLESITSNPKASYQVLLNPTATDSAFDVIESQETPLESVAFEETAFIEFRDEVQSESIVLLETASSVIDNFSVTFNEDRRAPGFVVSLIGLQESEHDFHTIEVWRRDPTGRYRDQRVRGLAEVLVTENEMTVTDYEAPIGIPLQYFLRLYHGDDDQFNFGPIHPQPQNFIPTMDDAYAGSTAFLKVIDAPELSRPLAIEEFNSWSRGGKVRGRYDVLGRRNPVVITDVMGGYEGSFSGHAILQWGQSAKEIENLLSPGSTLLFQNHNVVMSGIEDFYFKVESVDFQRRTKMVPFNTIDNPPRPEVVITFNIDFVEVDRPDPVGQVVPVLSWGAVNSTHIDWEHVLERYDDWQGVLTNPFGPESS